MEKLIKTGRSRSNTICIKRGVPSAEEYEVLKSQSHHYTSERYASNMIMDDIVFSVVVLDGPRLIGMGKVIGDGAIYFYIEDILVHSSYIGNGIEDLIMKHLEHYFEGMKSFYTYIGLTATKATMEFYKGYGFMERKNNCPGMYKIMVKGK